MKTVCEICMGTGIAGHPDSGATCHRCDGNGGVENVPEIIFVSENDDSLFFDNREDAECIGSGEITRYIHEKSCVELTGNEIVLKHFPLFDSFIDDQGNVWSKTSLTVKKETT